MGKDWELLICGRWKLGCGGGVTPRVLVFRLAVNKVHHDSMSLGIYLISSLDRGLISALDGGASGG